MTSSNDDEALLARLNALRKSNISLAKTPHATNDTLSDRLRGLRAQTPQSPDDKAVSRALDNSAGDGLEARDVAFLGEDPESLSDFKTALAALRTAPRPTVSDHSEIALALKEARQMLQEQKSIDEATSNPKAESAVVAKGPVEQDDRTPEPHEAITEEDIENLLAELNFENPDQEDDEGDMTQNHEEEVDLIQLPDTPQGLQKKPRVSDTDDQDDSYVELPSVPSTKPSSKGPLLPSVPKSGKPGTGASKGAQSDANVDDWCIICCDDATLRCVGCDGDLYCAKCWKEGHTGPDVGREERSHKAILFEGAKKKRKKLVAL
jgi:hypothetical protein